MTQQLERLLLFQRTQVLLSAPTWWFTTVCNSSHRDLTPSFGHYGHQACKWFIDTHADTASITRKSENEKNKESNSCGKILETENDF